MPGGPRVIRPFSQFGSPRGAIGNDKDKCGWFGSLLMATRDTNGGGHGFGNEEGGLGIRFA